MEQRIWHAAYDADVPPSIDYEPVTLIDALDRSAERYPGSPAVSFLNATLTYTELRDHVDRMATGLARLGVGKGAAVAIQLPNTPQTAIAFFAVQRLGARAVMTNPLYVPREIEHQWTDAGCEHAIVADFIYDQKIRSIREKLPVREYVIASVTEYLRFPLKQLAPLKLRCARPPLIAKVDPGPGIHFFADLVRDAAPEPPRIEIGLDEVALLQYTGGTTGVSKAAMLTQRNLSCNAQQIRRWFSEMEDGNEVVLGALPFFHIFGITVVGCFAVFAGAEMALVANPRDIPLVVKTIERRRVTVAPAVPAMFGSIARLPGIHKRDLSCVKYCFSGSAPLPLDIQTDFERLTGAVILEGYGLTETSPVATVNPLRGVRKIGSIGIPVSDTDLRIVEPEGEAEVAQGEAGEVLLKGPQVMAGYWKREDETAMVLGADGWFRTGDLATMDEDGYFRIVGRKKDMILASGYNIYPDEIDQILTLHPDVAESCTIGVPDPKRGETVKSFVVLRPGVEPDEAGLIAYCRENLASYKAPRAIEFREELPRSSVMKLLRRVLRDEEVARRGAKESK